MDCKDINRAVRALNPWVAIGACIYTHNLEPVSVALKFLLHILTICAISHYEAGSPLGEFNRVVRDDWLTKVTAIAVLDYIQELFRSSPSAKRVDIYRMQAYTFVQTSSLGWRQDGVDGPDCPMAERRSESAS